MCEGFNTLGLLGLEKEVVKTMMRVPNRDHRGGARGGEKGTISKEEALQPFGERV